MVRVYKAQLTEARQFQRQNRHLRQAGVSPPPDTRVIWLVFNCRCDSDFRLHSHMSVYNCT